MSQEWELIVGRAIECGGAPFMNQKKCMEVRWVEKCPGGEKSVVHWAYNLVGRVITGHGQPIDTPMAQIWARTKY